MDLVRASCTNRLMACPTPVVLDLQVDAALSAEQLRQSLRAAFQQKQWQCLSAEDGDDIHASHTGPL